MTALYKLHQLGIGEDPTDAAWGWWDQQDMINNAASSPRFTAKLLLRIGN